MCHGSYLQQVVSTWPQLSRFVLWVTLILVLWPSPTQAQDTHPDVYITAAYGNVYRTRQDTYLSGHLLTIGAHTGPESILSGTFGQATFDFVLDMDSRQLSAFALTGEAGLTFGTDVLGGFLLAALRTGVDRLPEQSWTPLDPGVCAGAVLFVGPVAIGTEARGWLGWSVYAEGMEAEPYFDFRIFLSAGIW
ncbi:MAG: hypothetical protein HUU55_08700 [Myxococcales bacterium]|nr:hypothetical protein [Myxococcales bacterium]